MKITICGSMVFHKEMENLAENLKNAGHKVRVPILLIELGNEKLANKEKTSIRKVFEEGGGVDAFNADHPIWEKKLNAIDDHFGKVSWSDAILVVNYNKHNIDGYVGGNTLMEIGLARYLRKKIFLLFPISSELSYKEEILALRPIIINNDITLVK